MSRTKEEAVSGFAVKSIDELASIHDGVVKLAGSELDVESFGLQVLDFPPGFEHYPEHDHSEDGQEEVYVVLRGSAGCQVGGEQVELGSGEMLRVSAGTMRKLLPGPDGVRLLAIGCVPGGAYERPADFQVAARS
ncbi:MAG TPA: cupin domain-containing protein [Thermoleophilaceae bacterium]|nr:cupin domain-containing protein [Thermoleophilaceae bacterium]